MPAPSLLLPRLPFETEAVGFVGEGLERIVRHAAGLGPQSEAVEEFGDAAE